MVTLKGQSVFAGIAIGKLQFYQRSSAAVKRYHIENTEEEVQRLYRAKEQAYAELNRLYEENLHEVGEANAMIFQIHQMMLEDLDYIDAITNIITVQKLNAEYAVAATSDNFSQMFAQMDDAYMKERAADVKDVSDRLINILSGENSKEKNTLTEPVIIAADDLAPSETVQLNKELVLGFATMKGSSNSHTAILARTMNLPAIIDAGTELSEDLDGRIAILDGKTGQIFIDPDESLIAKYTQIQKEDKEKRALLQAFKGKENITLDGKHINIYANIGDNSDIGAVLQNDAGGIGLFRSEFLYLQSDHYPTEDEQFHAYRDVAEKMGGKKVIIRTLDIGADKQISYFNLPKEENPAMGYRAIRICLTRQDIFRTQLRALCRASAYGKIAIMFPMVISVHEVLEIKKIIASVMTELDAEGLPYDKDIELGIMIETPAAAIMSDVLAKEVDFFSIGTNDLTQYTLALDRQNSKLDSFYDPRHPALLRFIALAAKNAHKNGIWIGICGELAADLSMTETFLAMGIDELSVSPPFVLNLRKKVRETDVSKLTDITDYSI